MDRVCLVKERMQASTVKPNETQEEWDGLDSGSNCAGKLGELDESFVGPSRLGVLGPWFHLWEHLRTTLEIFSK